MAKILILEDDPVRQKAFQRILIGNSVTIVDNVDDAIKALETEDWDELYLDHDLGGQQMVKSGPNTGYEVACWLSWHVDRMPARVGIHSYNTVGAKNMKNVLPNAVLVPGCWLKFGR